MLLNRGLVESVGAWAQRATRPQETGKQFWVAKALLQGAEASLDGPRSLEGMPEVVVVDR